MGATMHGAILSTLMTIPAGLLAAEIGQPAADFALPSIHAVPPATAPPIRLADYRGRVVYIHFWSAWCAPCREELPALAALRDALPRERFEVLSVNIDPVADDGRQVLRLYPVNHPVGSDVLRLTTEEFGVHVLPAGVLVDAEGFVRRVWQGRTAADADLLRRELDILIPGGASGD